MTRTRAVELLKGFQLCCHLDDCTNAWDCDECMEALYMAIEALENSQNCVKCVHYSETEDERGVHSHCEHEPKSGKWARIYPHMLSVEDQRFYGAKNPKEPIPDKRFPVCVCSLCGATRPIDGDNYCPNCGARMESDEQ